MQQQKNLQQDEFNSWKGNLEQVDDVCIAGIRVQEKQLVAMINAILS